ncbi:MAG: transketolase [Humidesulfovibrio sp.]|uniref:transketolase n=1 Tax=Humidesulfovibrio sp. TaxID=2910988 RepID=UPI0027E95434|nr:transketolase [Humidesulfovibrio sp.]MDQ7836750.1 transketolase [Humidesulfovibrio sp.]
MTNRKKLANAIRALTIDAVQKANSGHPGAPLGMADIAEVLFNDFMRHNPSTPDWPNRDRFVLSNGHGSMLLYAILHLSGYNLGIEDLKSFRQLGSRTPGHPEYRVTPGVESASGPLGQGIACAVGMAVAEKVLAAQFNRRGFEIVNHHTYVFMGDGCMMEGLSHEACSLAGTLGLGKLVAFYDDNNISIDGCVDGWFADNTAQRFEAYGWHVVPGVDGHDARQIKKAIREAKGVADKPSLIICKTVIGHGAPNICGSSKCHGSPLGEDEIACARAHMDWPHEPFEVPQDVYQAWDANERGRKAEDAWQSLFVRYSRKHPDLAGEFSRRVGGGLPADFQQRAESFVDSVNKKAASVATRKASQNAIEGLAPMLPELFGGSADLASSNLTRWSGSTPVFPDSWRGNYLNYGVREFAMAAMMNGMALHGGFIPYGGTFLVFSDYSRSALRMSALMGLRTIHVLTHDSIGVGEDGPTHQPVEHVASLRLIPNMNVWRPCDAVETAIAWTCAVERTSGPSALICSRQNLPHQPRTAKTLANVHRGGYVLRDCAGRPEALFLATGSEVGVAVEAAKTLEAEGFRVRVVSMPCLEIFDAQPQRYRSAVLPAGVPVLLAVEAGSTAGWHKYVGLRGRVIGLDRFGESAPGETLFDHFGITAGHVAQAARQMLHERKQKKQPA